MLEGEILYILNTIPVVIFWWAFQYIRQWVQVGVDSYSNYTKWLDSCVLHGERCDSGYLSNIYIDSISVFSNQNISILKS